MSEVSLLLSSFLFQYCDLNSTGLRHRFVHQIATGKANNVNSRHSEKASLFRVGGDTVFQMELAALLVTIGIPIGWDLPHLDPSVPVTISRIRIYSLISFLLNHNYIDYPLTVAQTILHYFY